MLSTLCMLSVSFTVVDGKISYSTSLLLFIIIYTYLRTEPLKFKVNVQCHIEH